MSKHAVVHSPSVQASRVQPSSCPESKRPEFRFQASRVQASSHPESKRSESSQLKSKRPNIQRPSILSARVQASSRPESKLSDQASTVQLFRYANFSDFSSKSMYWVNLFFFLETMLRIR